MKLRVLLVDDELMIREGFKKLFDWQGHDCQVIDEAADGAQALNKIDSLVPDLVIIDINIPIMNGLKVIQQAKAKYPDMAFIIVSGYDDFAWCREALRLQITDYILKPVDAQDVEKAVRRVAAQAEAERQLAELARNGASQMEMPDSNAETDSSDKVSLTMSKVKDYLQHNYMYDISLDSVSEILGMSPSYFSVMFKRSFGVGFVDYLNELRIQAAQELLDDPLRSTAEVASLVGYESANYFARIFKKKTGMTPTEYRRKGGNSR